jgi:hypothetical protein
MLLLEESSTVVRSTLYFRNILEREREFCPDKRCSINNTALWQWVPSMSGLKNRWITNPPDEGLTDGICSELSMSQIHVDESRPPAITTGLLHLTISC